ncbi:MAG: hypothetical protein HFF01_06960 [Erysipelotrichaceae bacterium]|nr:hypothetical protein [Erysipelotrichaceae bacterium]
MNLEEFLSKIPEIHEFLTVEEMDAHTLALEKQYPHLVSVKIIGESRKHHPLYCLKIGSGHKIALMYGCPHPNEPIGCMMLEHFSRMLCENEAFLEQLDTTFYLIKAIDPDGLKLNEGWLKGPFTYANYASHFFRPNTTAQVEWTFPIKYKTYEFHEPILETQAIMKLMEELRPDFVYSLHNASFGGVYWYVSHDRKDIIDQLPNAAKRCSLPLNLGEPECAFSKTFAPAVYEYLRSTQYYDYYEANLEKDPKTYMVGGGSSLDYMRTISPDTFVMMCEEPYFYCPDSNDLTLCENLTRKQCIEKGFALRKQIKSELIRQYEKLKPYADSTTMYMQALAMYADPNDDEEKAQLAQMDAHPKEFDVPASKASRFDGFVSSMWYPLLGFGMLMGAAKEVKAQTTDASIHRKMDQLIVECDAFVEKQCASIEVPCQPIAIRKLVSVQMESACIVLKQLKSKE